MPSYTLYYFNGRGRAEVCRMLFAAAGVQYTDKRFEFNEWDRYRKDMPCMCLPVLEIDSRYKMPETMAISRYLAREFGFYGRSNMDMFRVDYICDCFYEIMHDYMRYFHWKNGRFRHHSGSSLGCMGAKMSSCMSSSASTPTMEYSWTDMQMRYMESCQRILPFLERTLEMRNGGNMYYMGEQMMLCDIMCYCCLENPIMENSTLLSNYPKMVALRNRVSGHPKISMYLKRRCNTIW